MPQRYCSPAISRHDEALLRIGCLITERCQTMAGNGGILCTCAVGVDLRGKGFSASRGIELADADIAPQPDAEELFEEHPNSINFWLVPQRSCMAPPLIAAERYSRRPSPRPVNSAA